jgi:hypothetical protein
VEFEGLFPDGLDGAVIAHDTVDDDIGVERSLTVEPHAVQVNALAWPYGHGDVQADAGRLCLRDLELAID